MNARMIMLNQKPNESHDNLAGAGAAKSVLKMESFANYRLGEILGIGAYSVVRKAVDQSSGQVFALKFACDNIAADGAGTYPTGSFRSRPLSPMTGSYGEVSLKPEEFLYQQYQPWRNLICSGCPTVHAIISHHGYTAAVMDIVEGTTLRALISSENAKIEHVIALVNTMRALESVDPSLRHGDLKPENVLVSGSAADSTAYVLDPGYFGRVEGKSGIALQVAMTTPAYYPFLEPNDIFAVGIIMLEVLTDCNPLAGAIEAETEKGDSFNAERLAKQIESARLSNNYFPSAIYGLPGFLAANQSKLKAETVKIALKCMGLGLSQSGNLVQESAYKNFAMLKAALSEQTKKGIQ